MTTLYVWANPVGWDPMLQHTMVTTYNPIRTCAPPAPDCYWFCWGTCHTAQASPNLQLFGQQNGDLKWATCITKPNDSSSNVDTHGGIPSFYGHYGVCHQVANRTLMATSTNGAQPITVKGVNGSGISYFLYGAYATKGSYQGVSMSQNWANRMSTCGVTIAMPNNTDLLREMIRETLGEDLDEATFTKVNLVFDEVRQQKDELAESVISGKLSHEEFANSVNALLTKNLPALVGLLGADVASRLFDIPPEAEGKVTLLDPTIARSEDQ